MSDNQAAQALISRLVSDLRPVACLAPAFRRACMWALSLVWIGLVLSFFTDWPELTSRLMLTPDMGLSEVGAVSTAFLASLAALQTAVPGRSALWPLLPMPSLALWVGSSTAGCLRLIPAPATVVEPPMHAMQCMGFLVLISLPLSGLLIWLLRSAYPLRPGLTASLAGLASAAAAAALLTLIHPFDATLIDLLAHAAIVLMVVLGTREVDAVFARYSWLPKRAI